MLLSSVIKFNNNVMVSSNYKVNSSKFNLETTNVERSAAIVLLAVVKPCEQKEIKIFSLSLSLYNATAITRLHSD